MKRRTHSTVKRAGPLVGALAALVLVASGSAVAATIVGTSKNDVVHGTAKADKLYGNGGNDKIYGLGGNDLLVGGSGNDLLVGGPGADKVECGPGRDTVQADAKDTVSADCEIVTGPALSSISVANATVAEGNSGATKLSFPVTLSKPVTWNVSVGFATADGTASHSSDYLAATGTLKFAPGETSKTIVVMVRGDTVVEPDETLSLNLSNVVNATIANGSATGTIQNDDRLYAQPGHYAGMTSQNRAIQFDVSSDGASLSNLRYGIDIECSEVDFHETDLPIDFGDASIPIKANGSFAVAGHESDSGVSVDYTIAGLISSGSATGTLRVDFGVDTPYGTVHCSTESVTWSAS